MVCYLTDDIDREIVIKTLPRPLPQEGTRLDLGDVVSTVAEDASDAGLPHFVQLLCEVNIFFCILEKLCVQESATNIVIIFYCQN